MLRFPRLAALSLLIPALLARPTAADPASPAAAKPEESRFLRVVRDSQSKPLAMETSIAQYVPADGSDLVVDLISAVHIGESSYYRELNKAFQQYDALLYELVAPEGARPAAGEGSGSPVSALQNGMKDLLDLEFQLAEIDYRQKNFIHADMSPDEFARSMRERGESIWSILFRMMGTGLAQQGKPGAMSDTELLLALFDKDRAVRLKRLMADQFSNLEVMTAALNGPDGSTIITERNKAALRVLRREIDGGKKRIGIFYGAGHMPDMEERLVAEFGLKPAGVRWVEAWNLRDPARARNAGR